MYKIFPSTSLRTSHICSLLCLVRRQTKIALLAWLSFIAIVVLGGCSITPQPVTQQEQKFLLDQDRLNTYKDVEVVGLNLPLAGAVARGLKYNLEYRSKMMEQAIALGTLDISRYDMLPKVLANAGYNYRNNFFITEATGAYSGNPSLNEPFVNSSKDYGVAGFALSWNLLDFGVSYYAAKQNADSVLVASERRRRTMHLLVQDIKTAYLRAASAQKLKASLITTIQEANRALSNSRANRRDSIENPLEALRYQKSLLDNIKILQTIDQELSSAFVELNQLINLPASTSYLLDDPEKILPPYAYAQTNVEEFEVRALAHNADMKESIYKTRIAVLETRKSLLRLLPGLNLTYGPQTSNNAFYINKNWIEGAAQVSFNLWNLLMAPQVKRNAEANEELANQRRMMAQMAVVSQVYLSKEQLRYAEEIYKRSVEIDQVDFKIAAITRDRFRVGDASEAEKVAADASSILSRLRKYQALSQMYASSSRLQATAGLEPDIGSVSDISLSELTKIMDETFRRWSAGELPPITLADTGSANEKK